MTLGFVYTQGAFNFTVDAYNIKIDDRIVLSENISGSAVDDILTAADVSGVGSARYFTNAIDTETQGIDVVGTYDLDLNDMGSLVLSAAVNIGDTEVTHLKANPSELNVLGDSYILFSEREIARFESSAPDSKLNLSATWHMDALKVSLRSTRFGEWRDPQSDGYVEVNDAQWITDLDVAYQVTDNIKLTLGVNNLFDSYPKVANEFLNEDGSERVSTFGRIIPFSPFSPYGVDGRFVYGRISMNF